MGLMQIPRRVDYGLRAVIYLAGQELEKCCSITEISREQGIGIRVAPPLDGHPELSRILADRFMEALGIAP